MKNQAVLVLLISVVCSLVFCSAGRGSQSKEASNETITLEKYVSDNPEKKLSLKKRWKTAQMIWQHMMSSLKKTVW